MLIGLTVYLKIFCECFSQNSKQQNICSDGSFLVLIAFLFVLRRLICQCFNVSVTNSSNVFQGVAIAPPLWNFCFKIVLVVWAGVHRMPKSKKWPIFKGDMAIFYGRLNQNRNSKNNNVFIPLHLYNKVVSKCNEINVSSLYSCFLLIEKKTEHLGKPVLRMDT